MRSGLTDVQRAGLEGSVILAAGDGSPLDLTADARFGVVLLCEEAHSPDEARRLAGELLSLADWAEFGPGEWGRDGEWHSSVGPGGERVSGYEGAEL